MLLHGDVIRFERDGEFRVVWFDERRLALFDLSSSKTVFCWRERADVEADFEAGLAELLLDHAHDRAISPDALTDAQRRYRAATMAVIAPLVGRVPDILDETLRGRAVAEVERGGGPTAKTVHQALHRYWRHGMTPNAVVPRFEKCGQGDRRAGTAKRGRPRLHDERAGVNVTPEIAEVFDKAVRRHYRANRRHTLKSAYKQMLSEPYFVRRVVDEVTGDESFALREEFERSGPPSYRQFAYWYSKRDDVLEIRRKRVGAARYAKDMRAITGTAMAKAELPGSKFEIDATKLDVGCVSEKDRGAYVGRPTFYQVTDVRTKLIAGIYVGYEEASWRGAMLAVRNVVEDKVAFCARYGVKITRDQWPVDGVLPSAFVADRGEFEGYDATGFTEKSGVDVDTTSPYRGDQKGSGEKRFDMVHELLRPNLDGFVEKDHAERGDEDYRRKARMTLQEVTAAVIETVLFLNNHHELVGYDQSEHLLKDRVPAIPRDIWRWYERKGLTSDLRRSTLAATAFALLPVGEATVTKHGYRFQGLYYEGPDRVDHDLFARARQGRRFPKVPVSWDPLWSSNVYLHDEDAPDGFRSVALTYDSPKYAGISFQDVSELKRLRKEGEAARENDETEAYAKLSDRYAALRRKGREARKGILATSSLKGSRAEKGAAKERERAEMPSPLPRDAVGNDNESGMEAVAPAPRLLRPAP